MKEYAVLNRKALASCSQLGHEMTRLVPVTRFSGEKVFRANCNTCTAVVEIDPSSECCIYGPAVQIDCKKSE